VRRPVAGASREGTRSTNHPPAADPLHAAEDERRFPGEKAVRQKSPHFLPPPPRAYPIAAKIFGQAIMP